MEITVRNRGEPIAPPLLPLLFEPFFRAQGGASREGLGLGLFIAKELVVAHHGRINVSSTAEDGTRFSVAVPRWPQTVRPARPVGEP